MALVIAVAASLSAPPSAHAQTVDLTALQADDEAVSSVGYRLQTAAVDLCARTTPLIGLSVHDLDQYGPDYRTAASRLFERPDLPAVLAVARGGPADRAGVRSGDAIAAVAGVPVPDLSDGLLRAETVLARIDAAAADGAVALTLIRAGRPFTVRVPAARGCATRFQTRVAPDLNARADGERVEVTTGLLRFVDGADELAAVLAHELAHNILHHRERLAAAGNRPDKRLIRRTEAEADRLSIDLVERAGYRPTAILSFWERMRREHPAELFARRLHPSDHERLKAIGAAIALSATRHSGSDARSAGGARRTAP